MPRYIAIDTETTGGDFDRKDFGGPADRPYYVSTCDDAGSITSWEFDVTPSRLVRIPISFYEEFLETVRGKIPVFHNSLFDLPALSSLCTDKNAATHKFGLEFSYWLNNLLSPSKSKAPRKFHDTLLLSHLYCNTGSHGLKDLAFLLLDVEKDDESFLLQQIKKARIAAKNLGWKITNPHSSEDSESGGLKCDGWLPRALRKSGTLGTKRDEYPVSWDTCLSDYGDKDSERTMGLLLFYLAWLEEDENKHLVSCYEEQLALIPALYWMRRHGVSVNEDSLRAEYKRYQKVKSLREEAVRKIAAKYGFDEDFNPNSPAQMKSLVFNSLGLPSMGATKSGASSLDKKVIPRLTSHIIEYGLDNPGKMEDALTCLCNYSEFKRCGTVLSYFDQYMEYSLKCAHSGSSAIKGHYRIHGSVNPTGTDTTRVSHSRPNMGNVGKGEEHENEEGEIESEYKIRKAFGPARGRVWFAADYSQLQLNIFAHLAGETELIEGFSRGVDAHTTVARRLYDIPDGEKPTEIQRRNAKAVNFGYIFGKSEKNLDLIQPGLSKLVRSLFPHATAYLAEMKRKLNEMIHARGYAQVTVVNGYPLRVPPGPRGERPYAGVCYEVQGAEGVLVKRAMVSCHSYLVGLSDSDKLGGYDPDWPSLPKACMILQVHDELIFDFYLPKSFRNKEGYASIDKKQKLLCFYRPYLRALKKRMEQAGKSLGFNTPVSFSVVPTTWDCPEKIELS